MRRLYFIQAGPGGPIKIGVATSTTERLNALQTGSPYPLILLAECAGDVAQERALHAELAEFRLTGEWFSPSVEVLRGRLPHTAQLINLSSQSAVMHAWLNSTFKVLRRALETGTTPERALIESDREAA